MDAVRSLSCGFAPSLSCLGSVFIWLGHFEDACLHSQLGGPVLAGCFWGLEFWTCLRDPVLLCLHYALTGCGRDTRPSCRTVLLNRTSFRSCIISGAVEWIFWRKSEMRFWASFIWWKFYWFLCNYISNSRSDLSCPASCSEGRLEAPGLTLQMAKHWAGLSWGHHVLDHLLFSKVVTILSFLDVIQKRNRYVSDSYRSP